jgi:FlaA1/EpsC-like NDP-sugar epimerase
MDAILNLIGLDADLFNSDIASHEQALSDLVHGSRFLVIGGAGSIGQAVTKEIFARRPKLLHVVDISENNMVELVRDIRSSLGYIEGELREQKLRRQGDQWSELCREF